MIKDSQIERKMQPFGMVLMSSAAFSRQGGV